METYSRYSKLFITQSVTQPWDSIETCFLQGCQDIKDVDNNNNDNNDYDDKVKDNNNYDDNDNKSISALRLDKDLVFSRGHLGH